MDKEKEILAILNVMASILFKPYDKEREAWKRSMEIKAWASIYKYTENIEATKGQCPERVRYQLEKHLYCAVFEGIHLVKSDAFAKEPNESWEDDGTNTQSQTARIVIQERIKMIDAVMWASLKDRGPCGPKTQVRKMYNDWMSGGK